MRVPTVKVTIESGPHKLTFSLSGVRVRLSQVLGFRRISLESGRSSVSATLDDSVELEHVSRIGAATIISKESK